MELIPLNCNNCGSKLKVGEDTKFVTCKHCDAQLAVRHEDGAAFTDVLEAAARVEASAAAIEEHVEKLGADNEKLFVQGEIERLDRDWETRRESMMWHGKDGRVSVPTKTSPLTVALVVMLAVIPGVLIHSFSVIIPEFTFAWAGWLVSLAFGGAAFFSFSNLNRKADIYQRALADHEAEREQLLEKLRAL